MARVVGRELVVLSVGRAIFFNVLFQIILFKVFLFITATDIFNPFSWFKNVTFSLFSLETFLYIIPLTLVTFAQGIVTCHEYIFSPVCIKSRWMKVRSLFRLHNLTVALLYSYIGLSIPLIYSTALGSNYDSFIITCGDKRCLSEERLFFVFSGLWTGLYYFVRTQLFRSKALMFPFIQQQKALVIKSSLLPSLKSAIRFSLLPMFLYLIFYYLQLNEIINWIGSAMSLSISSNESHHTKLLSLKRMMYLWLFSIVIIFTLKMMEVMIRLYLTQRHFFHLYRKAVEPQNTFILEEALRRADIPILQHLGFLDLVLISEMDPNRRQEIFTLSQPGGHPYTWNGICKECFFMIDSFTSSMEESLKPPKQIIMPHHLEPVSERPQATDYFLTTNEDYTSLLSGTLKYLLRSIQQCTLKWISVRVISFQESRIIKYIFMDVPEYRISYLLFHSLPVIWAIESLSYLVCHSLTEDQYGIVQNDIPKVVGCLLKLKTSLESLSKQEFIKQGYRFEEPVFKMHSSLKSAVKRSLYRIAVTFRPFITDLKLPVKDESQLQLFLSFRE